MKEISDASRGLGEDQIAEALRTNEGMVLEYANKWYAGNYDRAFLALTKNLTRSINARLTRATAK